MSFILKEAFKLVLRSKLNFFLNMISLTLCVILIAISFYLIRASKYLQEYVQQNVNLNIFIKDNPSTDTLNYFQKKLNEQAYTAKVEFISKDKAAEIFLKETGEDFRKILDYNPLPASYTLYLNKDYMNKDSLEKIISSIEKEAIVTEVVSRMDFFQKIISFSERIKFYIFIFTGFMLLVSVYLVYSTVKLIMNSKYDELETMKLVGAKLITIKLPIIINIIFIGILSGIISLSVFYTIVTFFKIDWSLFISITGFNFPLFVAILILAGPFIGSLVTIIALRKISLRV
ncbi:permease-like cell division protein FtsX [Ignavibacterium sp.]|uniref:cell division protein FtsX n=1 Tax=Ignavibacterium sp. TaxID=2651167 RepID=UPI0025C2D04A|nr:permease-like cell division protein FtsX [Ignavibacterium sp.]